MKSQEFYEIIQKLEKNCLNFDMSENDYASLLDYIISIKNIKYLKKQYSSLPMSYFDLVGLKVEFINPNMARVVTVTNPRVSTIQVDDVIISVNQNNNFFDEVVIDSHDLRICAIRDYFKSGTYIIEERIPIPDLNMECKSPQSKLISKYQTGVIKLTDFNFSVNYVDSILQKYKDDNVSTIVIDLRGNMGGSIGKMSKLLELFIDKDEVMFYCRDKFDNSSVQKSRCNQKYCFEKIIIIVDKLTMSSAEIFSTTLQEKIGAMIVGERTGGKGTIISPIKIDDFSYLMYPKFLHSTPKRNTFESSGIIPTQTLSSLKDELPSTVYNELINL